jgi:hypothetical protein
MGSPDKIHLRNGFQWFAVLSDTHRSVGTYFATRKDYGPPFNPPSPGKPGATVSVNKYSRLELICQVSAEEL